MLQAEEDLLVLAAQAGNHQAFGLLCQKYQSLLLGYAYKTCGDRDLAHDALQEVWISLAKNIRKLEDPRALRSWLYKMTRWRAIDQIKHHNDKMDVFDEEQHGGVADEHQDDKGELSQAISKLPALEKQMIHLFYLDELTLSEIAIVLDIPIGTVKSRLNRARKQLKKKFDI